MTNNNLNILPFYKTSQEWDSKKPWVYGEVYPLISPSKKLLPFQIPRAKSATFAPSMNLYRYSKTASNLDSVVATLTSEVIAAGLHIKEFDDYDLIIFPSTLIFPNYDMRAGQYFVILNDGIGNVWTSEVFTVVYDLTKFIKVEYWDRGAIGYKGGHIDYNDQFKNYFYIASDIGKPEYPFEEDAQDRDGHLYIEKQISEKVYKFEFLAPEYLCDAIRIIRMHDYIKITYKGEVYDVENIMFDPKWREQGNIAVVEVEFQCDTVVKKIGKAISSVNTGDFNNDYNNDYNNV